MTLPPQRILDAQREHEREFYRSVWEAFSEGMRKWAEVQLEAAVTSEADGRIAPESSRERATRSAYPNQDRSRRMS